MTKPELALVKVDAVEVIDGHLTPELLDLMEHEKVIEQGLASAEDMGWALARIKEGKKYRARTFATFEEYVVGRWAKKKTWAYQLIDHSQTLTVLRTSATADSLPIHEAQTRPLASLRDTPELQIKVWESAVAESLTGVPTMEQVAHIARGIAIDVNEVTHPAKFSDEIVPILVEAMRGYKRVLDPFAGTGRIHEAADAAGVESVGIELEPEWAKLHKRTRVGNALALPFKDAEFDCLCTSPCYGNRLADHHDAQDASLRHSYTFDLGRALSPDNAGVLQWGAEYRAFHKQAWEEADRVVAPGGRVVVNISDHIRDGERMRVSAWHLDYWCRMLGAHLYDMVPVETSRLRYGENADLRPIVEYVLIFDKEE